MSIFSLHVTTIFFMVTAVVNQTGAPMMGDLCWSYSKCLPFHVGFICSKVSGSYESRCICDADSFLNFTIYKKENSLCASHLMQINEIGEFGDPCNFKQGCKGELICIIIGRNFADAHQCSCPLQKPHWNETTKQCSGPPKSYGENCRDDCDPNKRLICSNQKCSCSESIDNEVWHGQLQTCVKRMTYKESCLQSDDCLPNKGLICVDQKCNCDSAAPQWNVDLRQCLPKNVKRTYGGLCGSNEDCSTERDLMCIGSHCSCNENTVWSEGTCKPMADRHECNPHVRSDNGCPLNGNMECDVNEKVCSCPKNTEYSLITKSCKLKARLKCFYDNVYQHDLCASQHCLETFTSEDKTCACPEVHGFKHIWSYKGDEECVVDYYNLRCDSDDECNPPTSERRGLICKDRICQCEPGMTYAQAYCVQAVRRYAEPCMPEVTCTTDVGTGTSLTCGPNSTCVCLPKLMFNPEFSFDITHVPRSWNQEKQICELQKETKEQKCGDGQECTTSNSSCIGETCYGQKNSDATVFPASLARAAIIFHIAYIYHVTKFGPT